MKFKISENKEAVLLNDKGSFLISAKDYTKAIEALEEALNLDNTYERTYYNLGQVYFLNNEYEKAIKSFEEMTKLNEENYIPNYNLGNIYLLTGDLDKAIDNYDMAIEKGCLEPRMYTTLSKVYEALGEEELARENHLIAQRIMKNN